jgi:hypothetical protein
MKDLPILLGHLLATVAKLLGPGGAKAVVADNLLMKQQLLVMNRSRKRAPQSHRPGPLPTRLLVTVSPSTSYPAGCADYPTLDTAEIPPSAQTEKVSTALFVWHS